MIKVEEMSDYEKSMLCEGMDYKYMAWIMHLLNDGPIGFGKTKEEAIEDLQNWLDIGLVNKG